MLRYSHLNIYYEIEKRNMLEQFIETNPTNIVVFMRHGEPDGGTFPHLTSRGIKQIKDNANSLKELIDKFDKLQAYSSPTSRTLGSAAVFLRSFGIRNPLKVLDIMPQFEELEPSRHELSKKDYLAFVQDPDSIQPLYAKRFLRDFLKYTLINQSSIATVAFTHQPVLGEFWNMGLHDQNFQDWLGKQEDGEEPYLSHASYLMFGYNPTYPNRIAAFYSGTGVQNASLSLTEEGFKYIQEGGIDLSK